MKRNQEEDWQANLGTKNFDPLQIMDLQEAIGKRAASVELSGRKFTLNYEGEKVFYMPTEGFTPCGYLIIKQFLEAR